MEFVVAALAASGACFFSNPFDVLKTRMQLQGELRQKGQHVVYYKNVFHAGWVVAKNEGIRGLQKGLTAALVLHSVRNSIRLGSYQWLDLRGYFRDENGKNIVYKTAVGSASAGAAGAFIASPLYLIKTQLQSQAAKGIAVGTQHRHRNVLQAIKTIYAKHGITGLWRGANVIVLRALVGSSAQLTSFAVTKDIIQDYEYFSNNPVVKSFAASSVGGTFQAVLMTPFDLIATRLYNQGVDASGKGLLYKGIGDCILKIWKTEGAFGFYKGIGANYMRIAPHSALCLGFWDILRDLHVKYSTKED